ncbi:hypothetical protein C8R44DRAFT_887710 [Mycena epipterygia]|nr:hypothetical protein C8R44DRAFT_887710 [Mycena epipterygia]
MPRRSATPNLALIVCFHHEFGGLWTILSGLLMQICGPRALPAQPFPGGYQQLSGAAPSLCLAHVTSALRRSGGPRAGSVVFSSGGDATTDARSKTHAGVDVGSTFPRSTSRAMPRPQASSSHASARPSTASSPDDCHRLILFLTLCDAILHHGPVYTFTSATSPSTPVSTTQSTHPAPARSRRTTSRWDINHAQDFLWCMLFLSIFIPPVFRRHPHICPRMLGSESLASDVESDCSSEMPVFPSTPASMVPAARHLSSPARPRPYYADLPGRTLELLLVFQRERHAKLAE